MSSYEQDLEPLLDCIDITFQTDLVPFITSEKLKYKEDFLRSDSSKKSFTVTIKPAVGAVQNLLSKQYISKLKQLYFSDDGFSMYIFTALYKLTLEAKDE